MKDNFLSRSPNTANRADLAHSASSHPTLEAASAPSSDPAIASFLELYESFVGCSIDDPLVWQSATFHPAARSSLQVSSVLKLGLIGAGGLLAIAGGFLLTPKKSPQPVITTPKTGLNTQPLNSGGVQSTVKPSIRPDHHSANSVRLAAEFSSNRYSNQSFN